MSHLQTPLMKRMYPNGYPREQGGKTCGHRHAWNTATCIIDNAHPGRPHWGPDKNGVYREWKEENHASEP